MDTKSGISVAPLNEDETARFAYLMTEDMSDRFLRNAIETGCNRLDFAKVAANITEDRYSAGSTAARAVVYILLTHGHEAAENFVKDLEHHEN